MLLALVSRYWRLLPGAVEALWCFAVAYWLRLSSPPWLP